MVENMQTVSEPRSIVRPLDVHSCMHVRNICDIHFQWRKAVSFPKILRKQERVITILFRFIRVVSLNFPYFSDLCCLFCPFECRLLLFFIINFRLFVNGFSFWLGYIACMGIMSHRSDWWVNCIMLKQAFTKQKIHWNEFPFQFKRIKSKSAERTEQKTDSSVEQYD